MNQTEGILLSFCCDAPFKFLLSIEQLRRSLPRAKRRVALLCILILFSHILLTCRYENKTHHCCHFLICVHNKTARNKFLDPHQSTRLPTRWSKSGSMVQ